MLYKDFHLNMSESPCLTVKMCTLSPFLMGDEEAKERRPQAPFSEVGPEPQRDTHCLPDGSLSRGSFIVSFHFIKCIGIKQMAEE